MTLNRMLKQIKWKLQRLGRLLLWPYKSVQGLRKLLKLMGYKGVFWHMATQGRWPFGFTLFLCLLSLPLLYRGVVLISAPFGLQAVLMLPVVALVGWLHYILWRATTLQSSRWRMFPTRLYLGPVLVLVGVLVLTVVVHILFFIGGGLMGHIKHLFM